jgi:hypothetical protein
MQPNPHQQQQDYSTNSFPSWRSKRTRGDENSSISNEAEDEDESGISCWRALKRLRVEENEWSAPSFSQQQHVRQISPQDASRQMIPSWSPPSLHHRGTAALPPHPPIRRIISDVQDFGSTSAAGDADYSNANHMLGALHQQRLRRESMTTRAESSWSHASPVHPPPSPMMMSPARGNPSGGQQQQQRRKMIHLHTNSKLG